MADERASDKTRIMRFACKQLSNIDPRVLAELTGDDEPDHEKLTRQLCVRFAGESRIISEDIRLWRSTHSKVRVLDMRPMKSIYPARMFACPETVEGDIIIHNFPDSQEACEFFNRYHDRIGLGSARHMAALINTVRRIVEGPEVDKFMVGKVSGLFEGTPIRGMTTRFCQTYGKAGYSLMIGVMLVDDYHVPNAEATALQTERTLHDVFRNWSGYHRQLSGDSRGGTVRKKDVRHIYVVYIALRFISHTSTTDSPLGFTDSSESPTLTDHKDGKYIVIGAPEVSTTPDVVHKEVFTTATVVNRNDADDVTETSTDNSVEQPSLSGPRKRRRWADDEVSALLNGVKMVWNARQRCMDWSAVLRSADILKKNSRTPVDLKDKWRVMERNGIVPPMP